jgi:hypothetical protein
MVSTGFKSRYYSAGYLVKALLIPLIIILIVIYFILPLEIPYSFNVPGKVMPAEEWIVTKGRDGQLLTLLRDNKTGISRSFSAAEFERGDNARFVMNPAISIGSFISKSDTIGSIISNDLDLLLVQMRGQLNVTHSLLNQSLSGEKESLVQEAQQNLDYAERKVDLDRKIFLRQQQLFEKKFISDEEFDLTKNTLEMNEVAVEIARAKLQTVLTGEKKEQVDLIRAQITALEKEISALEKKSASFNLISPVNGIVRWIPESDTLLVISDTSEFIVLLPIPLNNQGYVKQYADVKVNMRYSGTIERIHQSVEYLFSSPVVFASAVVHGENIDLLPGLRVDCKVYCGNMKISDHLKRIFNSELF